jgi:non-lysosomal glucosylceramidase
VTPIYTGNNTKEISFPLGGIGTGCIGLSGNGQLVDWEIFNRPNKGSTNGLSFFAIKAEMSGKLKAVKILQSDLFPPYSGKYCSDLFKGLGFGIDRNTLAGLPHFCKAEFTGEFPIAQISFLDANFPGKVSMTAFNPFIPINDRDSSIPGAFFEIEIQNDSDQILDYTVCLSLTNPLPAGSTVNKFYHAEEFSSIYLCTDKTTEDQYDYGDLSIAASGGHVSYQEYWYRGGWFDNLAMFWSDFARSGPLYNRSYSTTKHNIQDNASIAVTIKIEPDKKKKIRFLITWHFPCCRNYWNPVKGDEECCCENSDHSWNNYYANVFANSADSAAYSMNNWDRLLSVTNSFKECLFRSTLPAEIIDAVSANISIIKTPTCLRLADGSFYGFEGCHCHVGCCEGSCTHVWNYAYVLPFLFPQLERSMRDLNYRYNQAENGALSFRLQLPIGRSRNSFRPCVDGQFGDVIKTYRDWKISGDSNWLRSLWPAVKKSIEFAWSSSNSDFWDYNMDGVLEGRQHHTLDMELFGPNSWLTGFYLAALKAGAEMAEHLGDPETADQYLQLFNQGKNWVDDNLYNGEYYQQMISLTDKTILDPYLEGGSLFGESTEEAYWNEEVKQLKYQVAAGCGIDQVIAQWHANICGLGEIFSKTNVRKALHSIYLYNYLPSVREHTNPCRLYAVNDEAGAVNFSWPLGASRPVIPVPYAEEMWSGCEYQAAAHMIQEGLLEEGLDLVKAVRDRYDGEKRNPWNEFECGSNYARSMASYSLLTAWSGFSFDLVRGYIGFHPVKYIHEKFNCFWCIGGSWGEVKFFVSGIDFIVNYGKLILQSMGFPKDIVMKTKNIIIGDKEIDFNLADGRLVFGYEIIINSGEVIKLLF